LPSSVFFVNIKAFNFLGQIYLRWTKYDFKFAIIVTFN